MQTFLPFPGLDRSARCLDRARLGKQRVEVVQLLRALAGETKGWSSHPAAIMWRGHEVALCRYGVAVCDEWTRRGYLDTRLPVIVDLSDRFPGTDAPPPWLGDAAFHLAHRSNLRRKDPGHYSPERLGPAWDVPDDLPYLWPVLDGAGGYTLKTITPSRGAKRGKERA